MNIKNTLFIMENPNFNNDFIKSQIKNGLYKIISKQKGRSPVWQVFGEVLTDTNSIMENIVCCRQCNNIFKFNGKQTTNLIRHKCFTEIKNDFNENSIPPATPITIIENKNEPILKKIRNEYKEETKIHNEYIEEAIITCATWSIEDCREISTSIDGSGFKKLANFFIKMGSKYGESIDIDDIIPHYTLISNYINDMANNKKIKLINEIKENIINGAAITSNLWTDNNYTNRSYLSATLHFIKDDKLYEIVLGIKSMDLEKLNGININEKMMSILADFEINKLDLQNTTFVTERDKNMIDAFCNNNDMMNHINCSIHLLNNVIENAFNNTVELELTICNCKNLIKYLKETNLDDFLTKGVTTTQYHPTRLNSYLILFETIYYNWLEISDILEQRNELDRLKRINSVLLQSLVNLCQHFENTAKKLYGSNNDITLHFVYTAINFLQNICQSYYDDLSEISKLKENILNGINCDWIPYLSVYQQVALFLYPPTNQMKIFDSNRITNIKQFCNQHANNLNNQFSSLTQNINSLNNQQHHHIKQEPEISITTQSSPNNIFITDELFFSGLINTKVEQMSHEEKIQNEIDKYSNLIIDFYSDFNALNWWFDHKDEYPTLMKLAKKILCIPAGCTASKRIFTQARNIITEESNILYPETINNIIFLNSINNNNNHILY